MSVLKNYCDSSHLEWNNDTQTGVGYINEFPISVVSDGRFYQICLYYDVLCDETLLAQNIAQKSGEIKFESGVLKAKIVQEKQNSLIYIASNVERLCALASGSELQPAKCAVCGGGEHLRMWQSANAYKVLCINCREIEPRGEKNKPEIEGSNVLTALFGAFTGFVIYIILYQVGNLSIILGAIMGFCVVRGYSKTNNDFTKRAALMCASLSFMTLIIAEIVAIGLTLYVSMFMSGVSVFEAYAFLPQFLSTQGAMKTAIFDVLTAYVSMGLVHLWWFLRQNKRRKN